MYSNFERGGKISMLLFKISIIKKHSVFFEKSRK